jgi:hypothetical protein
MKKQLIPLLLYAVILLLLFSACKKKDATVPSSIQSAGAYTVGYNANVRGAPTAQATEEVPLTWYKFAFNLVVAVPVGEEHQQGRKVWNYGFLN